MSQNGRQTRQSRRREDQYEEQRERPGRQPVPRAIPINARSIQIQRPTNNTIINNVLQALSTLIADNPSFFSPPLQSRFQELAPDTVPPPPPLLLPEGLVNNNINNASDSPQSPIQDQPQVDINPYMLSILENFPEEDNNFSVDCDNLQSTLFDKDLCRGFFHLLPNIASPNIMAPISDTPEKRYNLKLNMILAMSSNNGISLNNKLPWNLPKELATFKRITSSCLNPVKQNVVLMGRKTWDSIPKKNKPLVNRINIVLTRNEKLLSKPTQFQHTLFLSSFDKALEFINFLQKRKDIESVWVIGGIELFNLTIFSSYLHRIYLTKIKKYYVCDVFFRSMKLLISSNYIKEICDDPLVPKGLIVEKDVVYQYKVYEKNENLSQSNVNNILQNKFISFI